MRKRRHNLQLETHTDTHTHKKIPLSAAINPAIMICRSIRTKVRDGPSKVHKAPTPQVILISGVATAVASGNGAGRAQAGHRRAGQQRLCYWNSAGICGTLSYPCIFFFHFLLFSFLFLAVSSSKGVCKFVQWYKV